MNEKHPEQVANSFMTGIIMADCELLVVLFMDWLFQKKENWLVIVQGLAHVFTGNGACAFVFASKRVLGARTKYKLSAREQSLKHEKFIVLPGNFEIIMQLVRICWAPEIVRAPTVKHQLKILHGTGRDGKAVVVNVCWFGIDLMMTSLTSGQIQVRPAIPRRVFGLTLRRGYRFDYK